MHVSVLFLGEMDRRERNRIYAKQRRDEHALYLQKMHDRMSRLVEENKQLRQTVAELDQRWDIVPTRELERLSVEEPISLWTE